MEMTGCELKVQTQIQTSLSDFHCIGKMRFESKVVACNKNSTAKLCHRGVTKKCVSVDQMTACNDSNF